MFISSIVPCPPDTVHIVEDEFGPKLGQAYREIDAARADCETTLSDLNAGQYDDPIRVVAFNTREG